MLHTKFPGHRSIGSGEEDFFFKVFTIYGHGGHVGHVTQLISNFLKLSYEFWFQIAQLFLGGGRVVQRCWVTSNAGGSC